MTKDKSLTQDEKEEFWADHSHRRHTAGVPRASVWDHYKSLVGKRIEEVNNRLRFCGYMDKAWLVMLHEEGLVETSTVKKLKPVLDRTETEKGWGGEEWIRERLPDHDEDAAAAVNYGRTLQEPMARMMMREEMFYLIDEVHRAMDSILNVASENLDTVMAGHSHWSHAQPTTWGAYLLAVHDQLDRGLDQLELAYKHLNRDSGGCGACSGTGWPVDRERVSELLGFDETIELTYDCEASKDVHLTIMFAASSIAVTLTRSAMDHNVWITEEWNLFHVDMSWRGVSSFMPQKANSGNQFERTRMAANTFLSRMMYVLFSFKNEPVQDILPVFSSDTPVIEGMAHLERGLGFFRNMLEALTPNKERMEELVKEGYSGAPDLAITLIRDKGYGGRCAHRVCATMVRIAREREIPPYECTGALLDEAARISDDPEPNLSDEEVQESMSLENFFDKHTNLGDPNPEETGRLLEERREELKKSRQHHEKRKKRVQEALENLESTLEKICRE